MGAEGDKKTPSQRRLISICSSTCDNITNGLVKINRYEPKSKYMN